MNKVVTLAFCSPEKLRAAVLRFREQTPNWNDYEHIVFDCCYPIPSETHSMMGLKEVQRELGFTLFWFPKNLGVVGNYKQATKMLETFRPNTRHILFYDPDSNPMQPGWDKACLTILDNNNASYVSLSRPVADAPQNSPEEVIGGYRAKKITTPCGWPMGAYSASFLFKIDNWTHDNPYGYGENFMFEHFKKQNRHGYMLTDFVDNGFEFLQADFDPRYQEWKVGCAHHTITLGFNEWLKTKG